MKLSEPLIGLGGRLRSGKDAVADHLVAEHGYVKLGMSDALHEAMLAIDPIVDEGGGYTQEPSVNYSEAIRKYGYVRTKEMFPEARRLLQNLGTEVGRNMIGENVWVNIMARKVDDHRGAGHPVVVTGIRFPNEVQMIRELGGRPVWIDRPSLQNFANASHASENSVSEADFDALIVNDGTLDQLHKKASRLARESA